MWTVRKSHKVDCAISQLNQADLQMTWIRMKVILMQMRTQMRILMGNPSVEYMLGLH